MENVGRMQVRGKGEGRGRLNERANASADFLIGFRLKEEEEEEVFDSGGTAD